MMSAYEDTLSQLCNDVQNTAVFFLSARTTRETTISPL